MYRKTRTTSVFVIFGTLVGMTARVASIHFAPLTATRSIYGGIYDIPAVPLGTDPVVIEIEDKVQRDEGPVSSGPGGGRRQQLVYHVDGYEIASDLIKEWSENGLGMTPEAHPGIWVVRDRVPVVKKDGSGNMQLDGFGKQIFRPATAEEAQAMWLEDEALAKACDRRYAEWCYIDGNRIAADVRQIQFIPRNYKRAARQYGLQADWLKEGAALEVFPCPSCSKVISKTAMVCPHCTGVVDIDRYAAREAEKEAAVRKARLALDAPPVVAVPPVEASPKEFKTRAFGLRPPTPEPASVGV